MWQYLISYLWTQPNLFLFQVYLGNEKHISRAAHAFGAATGLLVGFFILKKRTVSEGERKVSNRSRKLQIGAMIIFGISVGILCIWHLAGGSGGENSWFNQNYLASAFRDHVRNVTDSKRCPKICPR